MHTEAVLAKDLRVGDAIDIVGVYTIAGFRPYPPSAPLFDLFGEGARIATLAGAVAGITLCPDDVIRRVRHMPEGR
jgi:hypothetical protein